MRFIEKINTIIASHKLLIRQESDKTICCWQDYVERIYIQHYLDHHHGKHEDRPQHWQQYLNQ